MTDSENPYQAPRTDSAAPLPVKNCPDCGVPMQEGNVTGHIYWRTKGSPTGWRFFPKKRLTIFGGSFEFTLTTPRATGHRCPSCGLAILQLKPDR